MIHRKPNGSQRYQRISVESDARLALLALLRGDIEAFAFFTTDEAKVYAVQIQNARHELGVTYEQFESWATTFHTQKQK